jgi:hypothetical protein
MSEQADWKQYCESFLGSSGKGNMKLWIVLIIVIVAVLCCCLSSSLMGGFWFLRNKQSQASS